MSTHCSTHNFIDYLNTPLSTFVLAVAHPIKVLRLLQCVRIQTIVLGSGSVVIVSRVVIGFGTARHIECTQHRRGSSLRHMISWASCKRFENVTGQMVRQMASAHENPIACLTKLSYENQQILKGLLPNFGPFGQCTSTPGQWFERVGLEHDSRP